jgi:hypothetical protein
MLLGAKTDKLVITFLLLAALCTTARAATVFMLHHSTGRNLIAEGNMRALVEHDFWDHDYNYIGLMGPDGNLTGESFNIPGDNTYPDGLYQLWTSPYYPDVRASILSYDVILFKSCYPAADITSDAMLDQYKTWYSGIVIELNQNYSKSFILLGFPPRHRLATNSANAARARAFTDWLPSLAGGNVHYFNLFDAFANDANVLRYEYERAHNDGDSHPNAYANGIVGPDLADFINDVAAADDVGVQDARYDAWGGVKKMFR